MLASEAIQEGGFSVPLDQLSTSQQKCTLQPLKYTSPDLQSDIEFELEQSRAIQAEKCQNNAPFIFFVDHAKKARLVQGCCNSWQCERCGQIRARAEYGRIVHGARTLSEQKNTLYFYTLTCRGKDMTLEQAEADYLKWTNKLLTYLRRDCKADDQPWAYAQITERQKRLHPHSHMIGTYNPPDGKRETRTKAGKEREVITSKRIALLNERAGLGPQYEITEIQTPEAAAVYVSKYLFKDSMTTQWPKGWRRVRYSQSWPRLPERKPADGYPLLKMSDWLRMQAENPKVYADSQVTLEAAYARLITCVIYQEKMQ